MARRRNDPPATIDSRGVWLRRSALAAALMLATPALLAQKSNELGFLLGGTFTPSRPVTNGQTLQFDPSFALGIDFDRRIVHTPLGSLSAGIDFLASPFDVKTNSGPATAVGEYAYIFLTPHLRFKLRPAARFEPWASVGIGYADYEEGKYRNGSANTHFGTDGPTGEFGLGVDYALPKKLILPLALRLDVRDFLAVPPSYNAPVPASQNNVTSSFGFVLKF